MSSEDSFGADEPGGAPDRAGFASRVARAQTEIVPCRAIGPDARYELMSHVVGALDLWPRYYSRIALALLYTKASSLSQAPTAYRAFMRVSAWVDPTRPRSDHARERTLDTLEVALESIYSALYRYYYFRTVTVAELMRSLGNGLSVNRSAIPLANLRYESWPTTRDWLAPSHMQPPLDTLVGCRRGAAIQVTVERVTGATRPSASSRLRLGIIAMGDAAQPATLAKLAEEMTGAGVFGRQPRVGQVIVAPVMRAVFATSPEERRIVWRNLFQPSAEPCIEGDDPPDIGMSDGDASCLGSLPMLCSPSI